MEQLTLSKDEIFNNLKYALEEYYDIELFDLTLGEYFDKKVVFLHYYLFYGEEKQKAFLPLSIAHFLSLVKTAVERRKHLSGTNVVFSSEKELKCRVTYKLTDFGYARRRRK